MTPYCPYCEKPLEKGETNLGDEAYDVDFCPECDDVGYF